MVWVWPPHTSMNLKDSPADRSPMRPIRARAATGSRYSSTNRMSASYRPGRPLLDPFGNDPRSIQGVELVGIRGPHHAERVQGHRRLHLVDLGHGEANVDQHPVADTDRLVL